MRHRQGGHHSRIFISHSTVVLSLMLLLGRVIKCCIIECRLQEAQKLSSISITLKMLPPPDKRVNLKYVSFADRLFGLKTFTYSTGRNRKPVSP